MHRSFGSALAAIVVLVGGLDGAVAADMAVKARPMPVAVAYNWSGCYIGGNVGGKWARTSGSVDVPAATGPGGASGAASTPLFSNDAGTFIGGGQVGCNWQSGNWVFGIEGDADGQRWSTSRTLLPGVLPPFVPGDVFDIRSDWQASVRGRIGYAWDRTLLSATGGAAFTNVRVGTNFIPFGGFPATVAFDSKNLVGGTVGAGVEYAVSDNWTVGVEGRYTWYGRQTYNAGSLATIGFAPAGPFTFAPSTQSIRLETAEVMLKANWKFNSSALVAAKY
jgi:outer membrane immunogenic protein